MTVWVWSVVTLGDLNEADRIFYERITASK